MTNGEKLITILKPRKDQIRIYDNWVEIEIQKLGINFSCELDWWDAEYKEPTTKNNLGVDVISRADALRVAKNEYLRGWHNALCKALDEEFSIHCKEGNFNVIQEETITGLGLSMDCALGKDVESYMSTIPSVTPQEPALDKIREEIGKTWHTKPKNRYEEGLKDQALKDMQIIDKYKVESEEICQN